MSQVIRQVIVYVLYFLIAVVIVGAIIVAITSKDKTNAPSKEGESAQQQDKEADAHADSSGDVHVTGQPAANQLAGSTVARGASNTTHTANSELADSGPGETAALFVVSTVAGYALYRRRLTKRTSL